MGGACCFGRCRMVTANHNHGRRVRKTRYSFGPVYRSVRLRTCGSAKRQLKPPLMLPRCRVRVRTETSMYWLSHGVGAEPIQGESMAC
jgi:hypothetical protein